MNQYTLRPTRVSGYGLLATAALVGPSLPSSRALAQSSEHLAPALTNEAGELLPPDAIGPTIVEGLDEVLAREARLPKTAYDRRMRSGAQGEWVIASLKRHGTAHSGSHYATNKWGDPRMGIGFGRAVDLTGAWFIGQDDASLWPASIVVVGYREGAEVGHTAPFASFSEAPVWLGIGLYAVDRIEIEVAGSASGAYGMDDLTFVRGGTQVVVDFESMNYQDKLTGSGHAGLDWETGTGDMRVEVIHPPLSVDSGLEIREDEQQILGGGGTAPTLVSSFVGPKIGDPGGGWIPPDTCGAVGPTHFVTVVNSNISAYVKSTGARVMNTSLQAFLPGNSFGDPRVTFDITSQRFIVLATDFNQNEEIALAISNSTDPTGVWTKAFFAPDQSTDAGKWPDYPTLGVNKDFIVTCAYMVGGANQMSIFAIDKQDFINTGTLTVTAFRNKPWEGAIHPATTWDANASQYLVSRVSGQGLRIRRLNTPANAPTLSELGIAATTVGSSPPNAPQQGGAGLDTLDGRLMNSVWANGSLWTTNCIASNGKAGCRWYQVNTTTITVPQAATLDDASLHFFMPSIAVNASDQVAMGFSGSNANQFAGAYFTGRVATDPAGQMVVPVQYKTGESTNNDGRWGDSSLTSVDPVDDSIFWTVQEYARTGGSWGTYIAQLQHSGGGGCSSNNFCTTSANSVGSGSIIFMSGSGSVAANDFGVYADFNPPNQNGIFFMGPNETSVPFGNGNLCVNGALTRYPVVQCDALGLASYAVDNTVPPALGKIVAGSTWKWQFWYRDTMGGGAFFNLSDGLSVSYCP